jgi:hypothetical protein
MRRHVFWNTVVQLSKTQLVRTWIELHYQGSYDLQHAYFVNEKKHLVHGVILLFNTIAQADQHAFLYKFIVLCIHIIAAGWCCQTVPLVQELPSALLTWFQRKVFLVSSPLAGVQRKGWNPLLAQADPLAALFSISDQRCQCWVLKPFSCRRSARLYVNHTERFQHLQVFSCTTFLIWGSVITDTSRGLLQYSSSWSWTHLEWSDAALLKPLSCSISRVWTCRVWSIG